MSTLRYKIERNRSKQTIFAKESTRKRIYHFVAAMLFIASDNDEKYIFELKSIHQSQKKY